MVPVREDEVVITVSGIHAGYWEPVCLDRVGVGGETAVAIVPVASGSVAPAVAHLVASNVVVARHCTASRRGRCWCRCRGWCRGRCRGRCRFRWWRGCGCCFLHRGAISSILVVANAPRVALAVFQPRFRAVALEARAEAALDWHGFVLARSGGDGRLAGCFLESLEIKPLAFGNLDELVGDVNRFLAWLATVSLRKANRERANRGGRYGSYLACHWHQP